MKLTTALKRWNNLRSLIRTEGTNNISDAFSRMEGLWDTVFCNWDMSTSETQAAEIDRLRETLQFALKRLTVGANDIQIALIRQDMLAALSPKDFPPQGSQKGD